MFNIVVTADGRIGSLDTQRLHSRVHEFGAFFHAMLADELRAIGARVAYDENEQAVVLEAIPEHAVAAFSKGRQQVLRSAKAFAERQGHDWDELSAEAKFGILANAGLASRLKKHGDANDRDVWRAEAADIGWSHKTILEKVAHPTLTDAERFEAAYAFAAKHLAKEFHTAAVVDHDKLRMYAARGLIGAGIAGGVDDIDRVTALLEERGIDFQGERVALVVGLSGERVRVTNTAQLRLEEQLADLARRASLDRSSCLSAEAIRDAVAGSGLDFDRNPDHGRAQLAAIRALGSGGALTLLTGVAGAGKTTLLAPLVAAWRADTCFDAGGRKVIGLATGWKQADALGDAGIDRTLAIEPLLRSIEKGEFDADRNTVLVIDEISQVAPRAMLELLKLQARTGLTIKALGDREQAQAVEAGDTVELLQRALPKVEQVELLTSVRQNTKRDRKVANLFRGEDPELGRAGAAPQRRTRRPKEIGDPDADARAENRQTAHLEEVKQALRMKRDEGTARFVGGDHDQVLARIADFYMERRDALLASGSKRGITVSALTNADTADISIAIRQRMKARGEIGADETIYQAVDQRGERYDLAIATGDRLRLFRRTYAKVDGKAASIGNNGDIVEVAGRWAGGLLLRDRDGRLGQVEWRRLEHERTGRLYLAHGHAMTIDAAQGITSDEHINALPRGAGGMTGFKAYVAESRARGTTWTMISDEATFEQVRSKRALGDQTPLTAEDMWDQVAENMASKPYKALGIDLLQTTRDDREHALRAFMEEAHRIQALEQRGVDVGREFQYRAQAEAVRGHIPALLASLDRAISSAAAPLAAPMSDRELHLRGLRVDAEHSRRELETARRLNVASPSPGP